jgi:hypothetical protein
MQSSKLLRSVPHSSLQTTLVWVLSAIGHNTLTATPTPCKVGEATNVLRENLVQ